MYESTIPYDKYLSPEQPRVKVEIELDREKAVSRAQSIQGVKVAVDCSYRNNLIGVGACYNAGITQHLTVTDDSRLNVYLGELYAIQWAVETLVRTLDSEFPHSVHITVLSDSQSALKALKKPARQSGQWLLRKITLDIDELKRRAGHTVSLHWVPGHSKVEENEKADLAARAATEIGMVPGKTLPRSKAVVLREVISTLKHRVQKFTTKTAGKFTRELDHALPGKHTKRLYNRLSRDQAAVLSQLRTGKNRLNYYLAKAKIIESSTCECKRESETVGHFLLRCSRWKAERVQMFKTLGKPTGDLSLLLGGWDPRTHPERKTWHPDLKATGAAIQFVQDTRRFEEETAERREPEPEGEAIPEGTELPQRQTTWERETRDRGERTNEGAVLQIRETSRRRDVGSQNRSMAGNCME